MSAPDNASLAESEFKRRPTVIERIAPLEDRLVVRPDRPEEMVGSFYIPDVAQQRPARGLVVAIGPDVTGLAPGDRVVYGHFTGTEVLHFGEEMLLMRQADVHARLIVVHDDDLSDLGENVSRETTREALARLDEDGKADFEEESGE